MNKLTEVLLAAGITEEDELEFARWHYNEWMYTPKFERYLAWEAPCGIMKEGCFSGGSLSYMGVEYSQENNNPRYGCPFEDGVNCPHKKSDIKNFPGMACVYQLSNKAYDYIYSKERIEDHWHKLNMEDHNTQIAGTLKVFCACRKYDKYNRSYSFKLNPESCAYRKCKNGICCATGKERNLKNVNIYYDILRKWKYKLGLAEWEEKRIEKGLKVFSRQVALTTAEDYLRMCKVETGTGADDGQDLYFSENHPYNTGEYSYFHFEREIVNIRIESRESRDLIQDLADIAEGMEVVHASDVKKRKAENKRERKKKRQEAKERKAEKSNISRWLSDVDDETKSESHRLFCREQLDKRGIGNVQKNKYVQVTLFDA